MHKHIFYSIDIYVLCGCWCVHNAATVNRKSSTNSSAYLYRTGKTIKWIGISIGRHFIVPIGYVRFELRYRCSTPYSLRKKDLYSNTTRKKMFSISNATFQFLNFHVNWIQCPGQNILTSNTFHFIYFERFSFSLFVLCAFFFLFICLGSHNHFLYMNWL